MKYIKKNILFLITFFCFLCNVNAANNPYPKYEESLFGGQIINCTWYAWQQAKDNMGVELPLWTYVQTWYSKAQKAGYSVGKEPRPNSIMVWDYGEGYGGHVAYVTSVDGTTVTYNEGGSPMTVDGINTDSMTLDMMSSFLVGFIYLDEVPKPVEQTPVKPVTPSKEASNPQVEEPAKSSNNYLNELTISGIETNFQKEIFDYTFDVEYEIESITIAAKTEDSKATLVGNGTFPLAIGDNNFTILVTAEDTKTKEYHITIKRQEEKKKQEEPTTIDNDLEIQPKVSKKNMIMIAVVSSLALLLIVSIVYILINKINKKIKDR